MCCHPSLFAVDQDLVDRLPISQIAQRYEVSSDSLYRHLRWHLTPMLNERLAERGELSAVSMAQRIVDIANDARQARLTAYALGNRVEGGRLGDAELRAVNTLMERLGVDADDLGNEIRGAGAIAEALGALVRSHPELGEELGQMFDESGEGELARTIRVQAHRTLSTSLDTKELR